MKRILACLLACCMLLFACAKTEAPAPTEQPEAAAPTEEPAAPTEEPAAPTQPDDEPIELPEMPADLPEEPASETRAFTDSVGRTVEVPTNIERVAISGPLAQIVVFALCPDKLVGIAQKWDKSAE